MLSEHLLDYTVLSSSRARVELFKLNRLSIFNVQYLWNWKLYIKGSGKEVVRYRSNHPILSNLAYTVRLSSIYNTIRSVLLRLLTEVARKCQHLSYMRFLSMRTYVIRSFRSFSFFSPPKAIFVPGIYFFGFSRYSNYYSCYYIVANREGRCESVPECPRSRW